MAKSIRLHAPMSRRASLALLALGGVGMLPTPSRGASKEYGPGVSDTEIKIGNTMPYSGPASGFGVNGRAQAAYYKMLNEQRGGVNGRKINFISLDDGYSPPKAVELVRRLVEQDEVLGMFGTLGTPTNAAVQKYLNDHKVPQFFVFSGVARFRDPKTFPWTVGADLDFINETTVFAHYILTQQLNAKIAVLYQNDDYGKDHLAGLRAGLSIDARRIIKTASYEVTDATVESQIIELKAAGADVLVTAAIPKFAAQAIRKMHEIDWKPLHLLAFPAATIPGTFKPAGLDASTGIVTAEFIKQPGDPAWDADAEMVAYLDFLKRYAPDLNPDDKFTVMGYYCGAALAKVLEQCGDNLTRINVREKMTHLQKLAVPMLLPGITMNSTPENYSIIRQMQLQRFDGSGWVKIGNIAEG